MSRPALLALGPHRGAPRGPITPLALLMGQTAHRVPVRPLVCDRGAEARIGSIVGVALLVAAHRLQPQGRKPAQAG